HRTVPHVIHGSRDPPYPRRRLRCSHPPSPRSSPPGNAEQGELGARREVLGRESPIQVVHQRGESALARAERFALLQLEGSQRLDLLPRRSAPTEEETAR